MFQGEVTAQSSRERLQIKEFQGEVSKEEVMLFALIMFVILIYFIAVLSRSCTSINKT